MSDSIILKMNNIEKSFSGIRALNGVSLEIKKGQIHALVGENGAGKSTLMKILCGIYPTNSYSGTVELFGERVKFNKPKEAEEAGIAIIHQELALINDMSVAENIFLGRWDAKRLGQVNWKSINEKAEKILQKLDLNIDVKTPVRNLGVGHQQLVEIAKALSLESKILILDEPTAALTDKEIEELFKVLRELKKEGMTMVYISHRMQEIFDMTDSVTVLRDGKSIKTLTTSKTNNDEIVSLMIGRELTDMYPKEEIKPGKELIRIENFTVPHPYLQKKNIVDNVSFNVREGEIVGFSGLLGAGRSELFSAICGGYIKKGYGKILLEGKEVSIHNPKQAIDKGIAMVTEDRKQSGLILSDTIKTNTSLAVLKRISKSSIINRTLEKEIAEKYFKSLRIKGKDIYATASSLSGGNQQKVVLAKWLEIDPKILILDEPTRGVDVGAKAEIYNIIKQLAAQGVGIIMISSDLPEVIGMSDRVYVMCEGRVTGKLPKSKLNEKEIMLYATNCKNDEDCNIDLKTENMAV